MAITDFKPFAIGTANDITPQADYAASTWLRDGWRSGILPHAQINKVLRQATMPSAALMQLVANQLHRNILDDGNFSQLVDDIAAGLGAGLPFDPDGTYPAGSIGDALRQALASGGAFFTTENILALLDNAVDVATLTNDLRNRIALIDTPETGLVTKVADLITTYGSTANAAVSAANAAQALIDATAAANAAALSAGQAFTSQTNATNAATTATAKAAEASASASTAATASDSAGGSAATASTKAAEAASSAFAAAGSATAANNSASSASTSAGNAGTYASAAQDSATTATTAAGSASTSAGAASSSATSAQGSASLASTKADLASAAADAAAGSASAAANSASTASTQAGNAATSAAAANTSALTASTQAGVATTQAGIATGAASTATTKASEAVTSATDAASSASSASSSAIAASNSANAAGGSASAAAGFANTASTKATEASNSATAANSSAISASSSAGTATSAAASASSSAGSAASAATDAAGYAAAASSHYTNTVSATGALTAAVATKAEASTVSALDGRVQTAEANYVIKVAAVRGDGLVVLSGIGLASTANNAVAQSAMVFQADSFTFVPSSNPNATPTSVLAIGTINGVTRLVVPGAIIGDLSVGTLSIANQAVTLPIGSSTNVALYPTPTGFGQVTTTLCASVTIPSTGAPIFISAGISVRLYPNAATTEGSSAIAIRRRAGSSPTGGSPVLVGYGVGISTTGELVGGTISAPPLIDQPGAGTWTYSAELEVACTVGFAGSSIGPEILNRGIVVLETKK